MVEKTLGRAPPLEEDSDFDTEATNDLICLLITKVLSAARILVIPSPKSFEPEGWKGRR